LIDCVIFDVDDVVVDTDAATRAGSQAVVELLGPDVGGRFARSYETLIANLRGQPAPDYARLRSRIEWWQRDLKEVKPWSRECLIAIAMEDAGRTPAQVDQAARAYWQELTDKTVLYDDFAALAEKLVERRVKYHFATNSDGFLTFDEERKTFRYDPEDSAKRKVERLWRLKPHGLYALNITVGDPIGKPHRAFYERVLDDISASQGVSIDRARVLAVGDSLHSDVLPFLAAGVGHGAWLKRHGELEKAQVPVIRTLTELEPLL
jgi:FMN phosphatase YigB (HAD superfamily)